MSTFRPQSMSIKRARAIVGEWHGHAPAVQGGLFAIGCARVSDGVLVGLAIVARPCRALDDGTVCEVKRLVVNRDDPDRRNACSWLLGRVRRVAGQLGYRTVRTYTLLSESGASLRGAGWRDIGTTDARSWDRPGRRRDPAATTGERRRWELMNDSNGS